MTLFHPANFESRVVAPARSVLRNVPRKRVASALVGLFALGMTLGNAQPAAASNLTNVTIEEIAIDPAYGNYVFIRLSTPPTGSPSCASAGHYWHFTFPLSGTAYKEIYAALLAAQMAGKTITVTGYGSCNEHSSIESMRGMNVQK